MSVLRMTMIVAVVATFGLGACKKGDDKQPEPTGKAAAAKTTPAAAGKATAGAHKVGDSCKGLASTDGVMDCQGNTKIFCSSYSKYKWKSLGDCPAGQKCVLAANGKAVSCK